jgi:hypothetical protein
MPVPEVAPVLEALANGKERFLFGLQCVPDDRLNWSPGGAAKTPLGLADKLTGSLRFMTHVAREGKPPEGGPPNPSSGTREEAVSHLESAFSEVSDLLATLTPADLERTVIGPLGPRPLGKMAAMIPSVVTYLQGQLNYCQTAYGDTDPNIPPSWRKG